LLKKKSALRAKQSLLTHQTIFVTSLSLFSKKGYGAVTINDICRKAGVSVGTFYLHFKSKEEVILEQFFKINNHLRQDILPQLSDIQNPIDKLEFLSDGVLTYTNNIGKGNIQVVFQSQISSTTKSAVMGLERGILFDTVYSIVEEGLQKGIFKMEFNASEITRIMLMSMRGTIYEWCLQGADFDLVAAGEREVRAIFFGLLI
jgi:TetR/AcrR family fatty acid metabolism transcriptional regulator